MLGPKTEADLMGVKVDKKVTKPKMEAKPKIEKASNTKLGIVILF